MSTAEKQAPIKMVLSPEFAACLPKTFGSIEWITANTEALKKLLPAPWTHIRNMNGMQLGFQFKLLGVDWRSEAEFGRAMVFLEQIGLLERKEVYQIRLRPNWVFDPNIELKKVA